MRKFLEGSGEKKDRRGRQDQQQGDGEGIGSVECMCYHHSFSHTAAAESLDTRSTATVSPLSSHSSLPSSSYLPSSPFGSRKVMTVGWFSSINSHSRLPIGDTKKSPYVSKP